MVKGRLKREGEIRYLVANSQGVEKPYEISHSNPENCRQR
jgi:hypothetical protein